eukprot:6330139-Lingulodinium_polyedra.AAC.1
MQTEADREQRTWTATLQTAAPSSRPPRPALSAQRIARARKAARRNVGATGWRACAFGSSCSKTV